MGRLRLNVIKQLFFTAAPAAAAQALEWGVINWLVPAGEIDVFTADLARRMAAKAPLAMAVIKEQLRVLMGGMRGNLVRSTDDGKTWQHQPVAGAGSFTACTLLADGRLLLVGVDGTVVLGDAAAAQFKLQQLDDRATLTGVAALPGGALVAASMAGARALELPK